MVHKLQRLFIFIPFLILLPFILSADFYSLPAELSILKAFAAPAEKIVREPVSFADLAEKLSPTVVNISTTTIVKGRPGSPFGNDMPFQRFFGKDDPFRRFFEETPEREFKQRSLGSGFIISSDGYIFTNNHVVEKADKIKVKLAGGKEYDAEVKGKDPTTDIALIKIKPEGRLPVVEFGDSDKLRIGEWVFAIGNPFGLEHTVTAGIVSAKGRVIGSGPYDNFIQTDASINPGNSGGPLFNMEGKVIGINTAIVAQGHGIGFAIPINTAKSILADLKTKGSVTRGWLGISIQDITEDIAENMKLKDMKGALVGHVFEGDPADKAGIKTGDIIVEIAGKKIQNSHELMRIVAALTVGEKVTVKITAGWQGKDTLRCSRRKERGKRNSPQRQDQRVLWHGSARNHLRDGKTSWPYRKGRGHNHPRCAREALLMTPGLKVQDIILQINRVRISSMKDFQSEIKKESQEGTILLLIKRGEMSFFVTLKKGGSK